MQLRLTSETFDPAAGTIALTDGTGTQTVTFANLETPIDDEVPVPTLIVQGTANADNITLGDGTGDDRRGGAEGGREDVERIGAVARAHRGDGERAGVGEAAVLGDRAPLAGDIVDVATPVVAQCLALQKPHPHPPGGAHRRRRGQGINCSRA